MGLERFTPQGTAEAIERTRQELVSPIVKYGPVVEVLCAVAGDPAAIAHGLGRVPDGYLVLRSIGGHVSDAQITAWTSELAWVVADTNNTRARLMFVATEEVRNA
jgi:hypothetical protein